MVKVATGTRGMVVTAHPLATRIGLDILRQGGNAVDAAVAVQFALAVVYPVAGNLGGGGFMLVRLPDGTKTALDFREKAPMRATRDMYLDSLGQVIEGLSTRGHLSVGVPGSVDGMWTAHERYGQLSWAELIAPALALARTGVRLTSREADMLNASAPALRVVNPETTPFVRSVPWAPGDLLVQADLARTLDRIARKGREGFYHGPVADSLLAEMARGGGWISRQDLEGYRSVWRTPLTGRFREYVVTSMPPPSSGGLALLQLLACSEATGIPAEPGLSVRAMHLMAEAERWVFADRSVYAGDPDVHPVPLDRLLDPAYIRTRADRIRTDTVTPSGNILPGEGLPSGSEETTHFSIVDHSGMGVSVTTTLNLAYGSKVVVRGAGFLLNNEMDDFSVKPGVPNAFGLLGDTANAIAPGKRMLSIMTPTLVERDGHLCLVAGTPGGSTIITSMYQLLLHTLLRGRPVEEAVGLPRFHHQWRPDTLFVERDAFDPDSLSVLTRFGHHIAPRDPIGQVEAIWVDPDGRMTGAADPRGDDDARGY